MLVGSNLAFDCADALRVASCWRALLRYDQAEPSAAEIERASVEHPEWVGLAVVDEEPRRHPRLFLQTVPEPKVGRNRIRPVLALDHDLAADVEGNEVRVVRSTDAPRILRLEIDAADPLALARFWSDALGFTLDGTTCQPSPAWTRRMPLYPSWVFVPEASSKERKNRLHVDLLSRPGEAAQDLDRLLAMGATVLARHDGFVTMQDPEGNEFDLTL